MTEYRETNTAIASNAQPWLPIDAKTPKNRKIQLINKRSGKLLDTLGTSATL